MSSSELLLFGAALAGGFIDAIAGGGGLILLPAIALVVGAGPAAVGTNKPAAICMAGAALVVYALRGHLRWRESALFAAAVGVGSLLGTRAALVIPLWIFPWALALTCPVLLYIVWQKDLWIPRVSDEPQAAARAFSVAVAMSGLACGFYDGLYGPGGGTFMFLALMFFARFPLLAALAASKLANTFSAVVALASYSASGQVRWRLAMFAAVAALLGGFLGARQATEKAARIVRPVLVLVVMLLVVRLVVVEAERWQVELVRGHAYFTVRLIGALLVAIAVPFLIDRRARGVHRGSDSHSAQD